jgi:Fe-S cluster assembly scaffold protein SufB
MSEQEQQLRELAVYKYGFRDEDARYEFVVPKGLSKEVVEAISHYKGEPDWMRKIRLQALEIFFRKPMPTWGADLSELNFDEITYYAAPTKGKFRSWDEVPEYIKRTYERLGIPEAERKFLAGVGAQYDCLTADTVVFANPGAVPIAQIQPGQYVYSLDVENRKLIKQRVRAVVYKGELPVFEVKVAGRRIKATFNHPFLALIYRKEESKKRGRFEVAWRYLSDLQVGDYIAIVKKLPDEGQPYRLPTIDLTTEFEGRNQFGTFTVKSDKFFTRTQKGLRLPEQTTEAFMWLLGVYLGDGGLRRKGKKKPKTIVDIAFPASEPNCRQKLAEALREVFGYELRFDRDPYRVRIHSAPIARLFAALGLDATAKTKTVPPWVFGLPLSQKLAFIAGFIDADGHVRGTERNSDAMLTSANENLLRDIQRLAITCGLRVSDVYTFRSKTTYKGKTTERIAYRLLITGDLSPLAPYSVKVAANFKPRKYYQRYNSYHRSPLDAYTSDEIGFAPIESIRYLGVEPTYDIEVEGVHNFVAEGIVVHNSEVVYHRIREDLERLGVIFVDMDTAVREYPDIVREYFGTVIPPTDNKFAALNTAVWSGGSFIYVPKGVHVEMPLQAYFRINAENIGQFERTLIIAEEGSFVHYVEGCTAPIYSTNSLHSAVVELIAKPGATIRYTTLQNWSHNVYNLVTKRGVAYEDAKIIWVDANIGCVCEGELVYTEHGPVPIEKVKPGTKVWSFDEASRQWVLRPVVARKYSGLQQVYEVVFANGRTVRLTANHPLLAVRYDPTRPKKLGRYSLQWVPLERLSVGDYVVFPTVLSNDGQPYCFIRPDLPEKFVGRNQHGATYEVVSHDLHGFQASRIHTETVTAGINRTVKVKTYVGYELALSRVNLLRPFLTDVLLEKLPTRRWQKRYQRAKRLRQSRFLAKATGITRIVAIRPSVIAPTYDLEIEGTSNFVVNGILVHNSKVTMKYPCVYMVGKGARGEVLSVAFASNGQHQDAGAKMIHAAPYTTSIITSKSISVFGGRATYRGMVKVYPGCKGAKVNVRCDALLLDEISRTDTYPVMEIEEEEVEVAHEATVSKIGEEQLFYLQSRGLTDDQAIKMIVNGFFRDFAKELPMEYAVEFTRLIELQLEGSVG